MPKALRKRREIVNSTVQGAWHIAGGGILPELHHAIASWLLTEIGETVSMLLTLFQNGFKYERREDGTLEFADVILPAKVGKLERLIELTHDNTPCRRLEFHNTYNIMYVAWQPERPTEAYMGIRLYDSYYGTRNLGGDWINDIDLLEMIEFFGILKREPENGVIRVDNWSIEALMAHNEKIRKRAKLQSIQHSANFLQAALTTYLDFNWKKIPEVVRGPALKQAAEQLLSHVGKLKDGENESFPSIEERDPEGRVLEWQDAVRTIARNTTGFEYKTARENDPRKFSNPEDKRGARLVNVDKDWARFSTSPFPRRMSLKLTPDNSIVYRRSNRLYIAIPVFKGLADNDKKRQKLSHRKIFWWHSHTSEFTPMPLWQEQLGKKANLTPNFDTILLPLQYDRKWSKEKGQFVAGTFERTLCNSRSWEICLSTLCERRARSGAQSFAGNTLHRFPTYFRSDFAVGFDMPEAEIPKRIIGIHFSHEPVISWVMGDILDGEPRVLDQGMIIGNEILDSGLEAQVRLEEEAGKLRWTGGREFKGVIAQRTNDLSNANC